MKEYLKITPVFLLVLFFLSGCQTKKSGEIIPLGKVENSIYENKELQVTLQLNPKWITLSQKENQQLLENYQKENVSAKDKKILLTTMKFPLGIDKFNPNILLIAEIINENQKLKTPTDFLKLTLKELKDKMLNIDVSTIESKKIGTISAKSMDLIFENGQLKQRYYTFNIDDIMLNFVVSFQKEDELLELENILQTLHVEK